MIIWLASYPRSGNTYFRVLLKHIYNIEVPNIYKLGKPTHLTDMATMIGISSDIGLSLEEMIEADNLYIVKTHDMPQEDYPAIYLVRDGRDALISHANFILHYDRQLPPYEQQAHYHKTLRELIETDTYFGGWSGNVSAWTARSTCTVVLKFEDLIKAPLENLHQAMTKIGYQPPKIQTAAIPTFAELHMKVPQFFRRGRVGSWKDEMPDDLHKLFWERHGDVMYKQGYTDVHPSVQ